MRPEISAKWMLSFISNFPVRKMFTFQFCKFLNDIIGQNIAKCHTLSNTHYDWREIEPVSIKANFIQFWCEESEFIVKNQFHNWTSELGCNWLIFRKFGSFQALQHWQQPAVEKDWDFWQWCWQLLEYQDYPKIAKNSLIFQKCAKSTLTLMSNYEINFWS